MVDNDSHPGAPPWPTTRDWSRNATSRPGGPGGPQATPTQSLIMANNTRLVEERHLEARRMRQPMTPRRPNPKKILVEECHLEARRTRRHLKETGRGMPPRGQEDASTPEASSPEYVDARCPLIQTTCPPCPRFSYVEILEIGRRRTRVVPPQTSAWHAQYQFQ